MNVLKHFAVAVALPVAVIAADGLDQPANSWVKRSPLDGGPASPRMGYEGACVWDSVHKLVIRYGGHNQGGGGEQNSEIWLFDPLAASWTLKEPNLSPPGVCCAQQDVFDPMSARLLRFPAFSGSHGWQWFREIYLNNSSVWAFDAASNTWRNLRPLPAPQIAPLRCASWDSDANVVVMFGGEGSRAGTVVYDPLRNEWRAMKPAVQPEFRSGGSMAYAAAHKLHILFGSQFDDDKHTWAYDLAKNEWRDLKPAAMPPTAQNDAVLAYDSIHRVVIAIVKITTGKDDNARHRLETWAYDAGANTWTMRDPKPEPDASGNRARNLMFAPELNVAILENRTHTPQADSNEQQIWTYRFAGDSKGEPSPKPAPPAIPRVIEVATVSVVASDRVELSWQPSRESDIAGYHIERATVEVLSDDQLRRLKSHTPPLAETLVGAFKRIGPFVRLTKEPLTKTSFADTTIDLSKPSTIEGPPVLENIFHPDQLDSAGRAYRLGVYAYRIRAVNMRGDESGPSPAFFTIPSAPEFVFAKENGTTCEIKWTANAEKNLKGYRVYRMDGRFDNAKIPRLTESPIDATTFADANAGKETRRYYIVAVDALGQEGFPSAPVWFNREWKSYYKNFAGDWHQ